MPRGLSPQVLSRRVVEDFLIGTGSKPKVAVAFSGGLDSTVLAHIFVSRRRELGDLRLLHVDHGLQTASRGWSQHCARLARAWKVPFKSLGAKLVVPRGESTEAAARDARYRLLGAELRIGEVLVTAQHVEDQAETLLLQLFRGAGVAGLSAMPARAAFSRGEIRRPLLTHSRKDLETYARYHELEWIEDPTNAQDLFARNFLRHRVMPQVRERWPGVDRAIARTSRHMAEAAALLDAVGARDLRAVADGGGLNVSALRALPSMRRRNALRTFIANAGIELPSAAMLAEISGPFLRAREDAQPEARWASAVLKRRMGRIELQTSAHVAPAPELEAYVSTPRPEAWRWKDHRNFALPLGGSIAFVNDPDGPVDLDKLPPAVHVRGRQGGETLRPGARARTQSLKKLLQAARLTVEQRALLPLLFAGEGPKGDASRLLAAGDRWIDASIAANVKSRRRARLVWTRPRG